MYGAGGSTIAQNGGWLIRASNGFAGTLTEGFNFSFFWCGATAIYLLLRRDADQTDIDEVFLEEEAGRYGLPPLKPMEPAEVKEAPASSTDSPSTPPASDTPEADER